MGQHAIPLGPITWQYTVSVNSLHVKGGLINHEIPLGSIEQFAVWSMVSDLNGVEGDLTPHLSRVGDDLASRTGQLWVKWHPAPGKVKVGKYNVDIKSPQLQGLLSDLGVSRPGAFSGWGNTSSLSARFGVRNWTPLIGILILVAVIGAIALYGMSQ